VGFHGIRRTAKPTQARPSVPPLVAWDRVQLAPGESKTVNLELDPKFLSIFDVARDGWQLLPGEYQVFVGASSRETPLRDTLRVEQASGPVHP
jgi:beta-glucosidase